MEVYPNLFIVSLFLWVIRETDGLFRPFRSYYRPAYRRNVIPSYRKYYSPLSYCTRMVYGKEIFFNLPYSYVTPIKTLDESNAQGDIKKTYGNMFMTLDELKVSIGIDPSEFVNWKNGVHKPNRTRSASGEDPGPFQFNSDICCSTNEVFFINGTLTDVEGIPRKIAQLSKIGAYQFIRHGFCHLKGACQGTCIQHFINLPLAVDEPGTGLPISFRFFKIPGYCSCRFIGF